MEKNTNIEIVDKINEEYIEKHDKIETIYADKYCPIYIYNKIDNEDIIPVIYVYIANGHSKNSSSITIINHKDNKVIACMRDIISIQQIETCIHKLVNIYMPNAIIDIERNGPGLSLLDKLFNSKLKNNIYYTLKSKEVTVNPFKVIKKDVKFYGSDNSEETRQQLMKILEESTK
jgi:hypothetical protein